MKRYSFAFVPFALFVAACGGDGTTTVDIVGKPPAEQAEIVADAFCESIVACGEPSIDITQEGETIICTATIEDADYAMCVEEFEPDILADLESCELTAEQEQTVQNCVNATLAQPCVTQAQLDAYCAEIEGGNFEPEWPVEVPAACEETDAIFEACETPA